MKEGVKKLFLWRVKVKNNKLMAIKIKSKPIKKMIKTYKKKKLNPFNSLVERDEIEN